MHVTCNVTNYITPSFWVYRFMEEKVDQLTQITAELTRRLQVWEKCWPFEMGAQ